MSPDPDEGSRLRREDAVRGAIIGYGILAYTLLVPMPAPIISTRTMILIGIGLQIAVALARRARTPLVPYVAGLVADGVTVLLFALATYISTLDAIVRKL